MDIHYESVSLTCSPNNELHLAPACCVHQDGNQLWVPRSKDAMWTNGNREETALLVTGLKDQLKQHKRAQRKHSAIWSFILLDDGMFMYQMVLTFRSDLLLLNLGRCVIVDGLPGIW